MHVSLSRPGLVASTAQDYGSDPLWAIELAYAILIKRALILCTFHARAPRDQMAGERSGGRGRGGGRRKWFEFVQLELIANLNAAPLPSGP